MEETVKKGTNGGARPGAGVKKGHKVRFKKIRNGHVRRSKDPDTTRKLCTCRLPLYIVMWLEKQDKSLGRIIEKAILNTFNLNEKLDANKWNIHELDKKDVDKLVMECEC